MESVLTILFYILLGITAFWNIVYRSGDKILRIILIYVVILGTRIIYKKTFLNRYSFFYKVILFFIFISMYLANILNFYSFKNYDKILHFLSGLILAIVGLIIYMYLSNYSLDNGMKKATVMIFSMIFAVAGAGAWEIWEFATDQIFGLSAQLNDLHDTMWDIICGTVGGGISCIFIYLYLKGKNIRIIKKIIEDEKK